MKNALCLFIRPQTLFPGGLKVRGGLDLNIGLSANNDAEPRCYHAGNVFPVSKTSRCASA